MIETRLASSSALAAGLIVCSLACGDASGFTGEGAPALPSDEVFQDQEGTAGELEQLSQAIVGGETDREHLAVVAITLITRREVSLCSGTLIAPNLVLTARHCVAVTDGEKVDCRESEFGRLYSPRDLWVSSSTTVGASNFYPVREVLVPDDGSELCGSDIALMIMNGQFRPTSIQPMFPRLNDPPRRGEPFTAVGFGDALSEGEAGIRRAVTGLEVVCGPDDCNSPGFLTPREFVGEQGVCDGDSGGPAVDAQGRVVGVASRATEDCGLAVYTALTPWRDWILEVGARAFEQGRYDEPAWLSDPDAIASNAPPSTPTTNTPAASDPSASIPPVERTRHDSSGCAIVRGVGSELLAPSGSRSPRSTAWATIGALLALAGALALRRPRR